MSEKERYLYFAGRFYIISEDNETAIDPKWGLLWSADGIYVKDIPIIKFSEVRHDGSVFTKDTVFLTPDDSVDADE